jgi:hypothetical protein
MHPVLKGWRLRADPDARFQPRLDFRSAWPTWQWSIDDGWGRAMQDGEAMRCHPRLSLAHPAGLARKMH